MQVHQAPEILSMVLALVGATAVPTALGSRPPRLRRMALRDLLRINTLPREPHTVTSPIRVSDSL